MDFTSANLLRLQWTLSIVLSLVCANAARADVNAYDLPGNLVSVTNGTSSQPALIAPVQSGLMDGNGNVALSVVAGGNALAYQWLSNGVPIPGATNDSLQLTNQHLADSTNYSVVVSNSAGSITNALIPIWVDSNGNGIPDWWEMQYFGNLNQSPYGDFDGDGVANIDEFREGTNPSNAASYNPRLRLSSFRGRVLVSPLQPHYSPGQTVVLTAVAEVGQTFLNWSGTVASTNPVLNLVMSSNQTINANFGVPLSVALNNTNPVWTTGGDTPWFGQTAFSRDGSDSAQSGFIVGNQQSWLQATVTLSQSVSFSFWWAVSSPLSDALSCSIDGTIVASISGSSGWQQFQTNLAAGPHTLRWLYAKPSNDNPNGAQFADSGWVDQVVFAPPGALPAFTLQPLSQAVSVNGSATLTVAAAGAPPLTYQWFLDGNPMAGAINTNLSITNIQVGVANYFAVASNSYGTATSAVATVTVPASGCADDSAGAVAWWTADGHAHDIAGSNTGAPIGGVSYAAGIVGRAFNLDGTSGYVNVPGSPGLKFSGPFTVEAWINFTNWDSTIGDTIVAKGADANSTMDWVLLVSKPNGKLRPHATIGGNWIYFDCDTTLNPNTWYHVAMVYDGSYLRGYVNGLLDGSQSVFGSLAGSDTPLRIGAYAPVNGGGSKNFFSGLIDELTLYNRALSSNEIASIYLSASFGKCPVPTIVPVITSQPASEAVPAGTNVTFNLAVTGSQPLAFQWFSNSGLIAGATNSSLTLANTQPGIGTYFATVSNSYGTATSAVATLTVLRAGCLSSSAGAVAWWPGEGNATDIAGVNNGTLIGGVSFGTGLVGQALNFNGTSGYINVPSSLSLKFSGPFTIEGWINFTGFNGGTGNMILAKGADAEAIMDWAFAVSSPGAKLRPHATVGGDWIYFDCNTALSSNTWYHVAMVYDGAYLHGYLNGLLDGSQPVFGALAVSDTPLRIGAYAPVNGTVSKDFFPGRIDELTLYNRALSSEEIQGIYSAATSGKCQATLFGFDVSANGLQWVSNGLQMRLIGLTGQGSVVVSASTNLTSWNPIYTNPPASGTIQFWDSSATNFQRRFYRAILQH